MISRLALAVLAAAGFGLACGSSEGGGRMASGGSNAQSGSGGASGSPGTAGGGGTAAGAAGSAGAGGQGLMLGDSPTEACIEYALAVCSRQAECGMAPSDNCLRAAYGCPDTTFSPGATRTVEGLKACAEVYRALPCQQVRYQVLPECVTPGTRQEGDTCAYASQCSSLGCDGGGSTSCGMCTRVAALGDSCDGFVFYCAPGLYCDGATCRANYPTEAPANAACGPDAVCVSGYQCTGPEGASTCTPLPKVNEPCPTNRCEKGLYCSPQGECLPDPGLGEPCGLTGTGEQARAYYCKEGLACHHTDSIMSGSCQPEPGVGEPCWPRWGDPGQYDCAASLHCNEALAPPLCAAAGKPGDSCTTMAECESGLWCECPPSAPDCASRVCTTIVLGGQRCDAPNVQCHGGFACESGLCRPIDLRGTFADVCATP